jgi:hypothetical protein
MMQEPGNFSQPGSPFGPTTPIPAPTGYDVSMQNRLRTIRRVDLASAFKLGAALGALLWALFGLLLVMFGSIISSMAAAASQRGTGLTMAGGVVGSFIFYLILIPVYAIMGGIGAVVYAFLYNLVAGWVGGLQVEID